MSDPIRSDGIATGPALSLLLSGAETTAATPPLEATQFAPVWPAAELVDRLIAKLPDMVDVIRRWVAIPTTVAKDNVPQPGAPYGENLVKALEMAVADAKALGFKTYMDTNPAGPSYAFAEFGSGNKVVLIPAHLDIVPTGDPKDWKNGNPFEVLVTPEGITGRGVLDNKGPAVMAMFAAAELMGLPLQDYTIRFAFFSDEERGGTADVKQYLAQWGSPFLALVPDAEFPGVIELPILRMSVTGQGNPLPRHKRGNIEVVTVSTGDNRANQVPDKVRVVFAAPTYEELKQLQYKMGANLDYLPTFTPIRANATGDRFTMTAIVNGKASHAARTWEGVNAVQQLAWSLRGVGMVDTPPARAINFIQSKTGVGYAHDGTQLGLDRGDAETTGNQTLNVGGVFKASPKGVELVIDSRISLSNTRESVQGPLVEMTNSFGFIPNVFHFEDANVPPSDSPVIQTIQAAYGRETGTDGKFKIIGGGTYAKAFKGPATIAVAFGMNPVGHPDTMHKANETLARWAMELGTKVYFNGLYALVVDHQAVAAGALDVGGMLGAGEDLAKAAAERLVLGAGLAASVSGIGAAARENLKCAAEVREGVERVAETVRKAGDKARGRARVIL